METTMQTAPIRAGNLKDQKKPTIELHTNTGYMLWVGRDEPNKPYIIPTPTFLKRLFNVERAVVQDDPWADKTYYEVEQAIEEAQAIFDLKKREIQEILDSGHDRVKFSDTIINETIELEITNYSRLGWRAVDILLTGDDLAKMVLTAYHRGRISNQEKVLLLKAIQQIYRSTLFKVQQWKYQGVTRDDVAANNQVAQKAKETLGEIEEEFLLAKVRSTFAPDLPSNQKRNSKVEADQVMDDKVQETIKEMSKSAKLNAS